MTQQCQPCDPNSIKQALAIAVVKHKRKCRQEADEWRAKAQRLEAQLEQQAEGNAALKAWASSILHDSAAAAAINTPHSPQAAGISETVHDEQQQLAHSIFLPPLTLPSSCGSVEEEPSAAPALQAAYHNLQQQLLLTAQASCYTAAAGVLNGRAAALSGMLLTNMRMLVKLQHLGDGAASSRKPAASSTAGAGQDAATTAVGNTLQQSPVPDTVAALGSFITGTLLQVPNSSMRMAYMQQCAALLAALLSQPPDTPPAVQQQLLHGLASVQPTAGQPLQQLLHNKQSCSRANAVAVQAVGLLRQLLVTKTTGRYTGATALHLQQPLQETADDRSHNASSSSLVAAAAAMLQQLSTFPSTALLMALAVAQELQQRVQQLQKANAAVGCMTLSSVLRAQSGVHALGVAAQLFEESYELLEELVSAL